jgi:hypothetical protein
MIRIERRPIQLMLASIGDSEMTNSEERVGGPGARLGLRDRLPEDFWTHRRAARRERLLGWRSLLDAAVERLDEQPIEAVPPTRRKMIPEQFWAHRRAARREDLKAVRSLVNAALDWLEKPPPAERVTRVEVE